ncbi:ATP-binding protein [Nocardia brasiliensis]|uniref:ATP-binding protein n=1 Tax=Nocardia brasiliensis TaxID=37326 RepID=UPI00366E077A
MARYDRADRLGFAVAALVAAQSGDAPADTARDNVANVAERLPAVIAERFVRDPESWSALAAFVEDPTEVNCELVVERVASEVRADIDFAVAIERRLLSATQVESVTGVVRAEASGNSRQVVVLGDNNGTITLSIEAPPPSRPIVVSDLPSDEIDFVGRKAELHSIRGAVESGRPVPIYTIDGMPGVGKTALVTHLAHALAPLFPDGQYFVRLHSHTPGQSPADPHDVLAQRLVLHYGIDPRNIPDSLEARSSLWRSRLQGKRVLLVLDDARDHTQIEPLLPAGSECLTLVTSRRRLITVENARPLSLDVLDETTAVRLFTAHAKRTLNNPREGAAATEIVRMSGYLPLAMVLLAGWLAGHGKWTIAALADQFAAATDRLSELEVGDRAVRAAFTMSYEALPPTSQRLFRLLSVHPGTEIDTHAAAALTHIPVDEARRQLDRLYTDHLLDEIAPNRYRQHDLLRDYATGLTAGDDTDRALDRLFDFYQHSATVADRYLARRTRPIALAPSPSTVAVRNFRDEIDALAWVRRERANLLACLDYLATAQPARMVDLTATLAGLLERDGPWPQARELHQRAAATAGQLSDRIGRANALTNLGTVCWNTGDYGEAAEWHQQALTIYRQAGNRLGEANALTNLGLVRDTNGDYREAAELHEQAVKIYQGLGDQLGEASARNNLGLVSLRQSDFGEASTLWRQALTIYRQIGNRLGEAITLTNLGIAHRSTEDYHEAADLLRQGLAIFRQIGNRLGEASTLANLAMVSETIEDYREAADLHLQALTITREIGYRSGEASTLNNLGAMYLNIGDYDQALGLCREALAISREIGERRGEAQSLANVALACVRTEHSGEALDLYWQALALYRDIGDRAGEASILNNIGVWYEKRGDSGRAASLYQHARTIFRTLGNASSEDRARTNLENLTRDSGHGGRGRGSGRRLHRWWAGRSRK